MDDDIRDRFRGAGRRPDPAFGRPLSRPRPLPPKPVSAPRPLRPVAPSSPTPPPRTQTTALKPTKQSRTRRRRSKKPLLILIIVLLLAGLAAGGYALYGKYVKKPNAPAQSNTNQEPSQTEEPKPTGTIRLIAIGDNLAFESINNAAKKPDGSYDYLPLMADFKPFFDKADIRLCTESTPGGGEGLGVSGYPTFNAPTAWSTSFASLGCNLINLGTNHTNDKGQAAIDAMLKTWDEQKNILAVAGANRSAEEQTKIRYFTVKDIKFAYLSYTTISQKTDGPIHSINKYSNELARLQITEARKNAQLVIVSMNWGIENTAEVKPEQEQIAQTLASLDVDVVIGGGPHIVQPAKVIDGKDGHQTLVWFSLGNFLTSELPVDNLVGGMAIMDFDIATLALTNPKFLPLYMHYEWTPAQKAAGNVNSRTNFKVYPLDLATEALAKSLHNTTVEAQTARITGIITKFAPIKVIKSTEF
ncbi:MAG: CapA family protein [Patescibacteria group bacterium]